MAFHLNTVSLQITKNLKHTVLLTWVATKIFSILFTFFKTAPPEWEQKIQNTYLSIYDSLFWECKATGKPNPWYTWLKNGERLNPEVRSYMLEIHPIISHFVRITVIPSSSSCLCCIQCTPEQEAYIYIILKQTQRKYMVLGLNTWTY